MLNPSLAAESNCYCYIKQIRQAVKDLVILLWTFFKILVYAHVAITRSYVTLNQQAWSRYYQQKWYMEESAVNVSQLSVHVSLCLWKLCTAWGWHLSPSCLEFWETADFCSVIWLTWLLQSQLSDFILTSVTCPLVPLFQLPLYLLWHFVPNIMLTGTTNLLHLFWFEKCSQNPSSQLLCVFLQKECSLCHPPSSSWEGLFCLLHFTELERW